MITSADFLHAITTVIGQQRWDVMLAYADWLDERGDMAAEAWRWLATERQPWLAPVGHHYFTWSAASENHSGHCALMYPVWAMLTDFAERDSWGKYYCTAEAAYLAVVSAYLAARRAGWEPGRAKCRRCNGLGTVPNRSDGWSAPEHDGCDLCDGTGTIGVKS